MNTNFLKTQKNILKVALLLTLSISFFCSSNDKDAEAVVAVEQNPLAGYTTASGLKQIVI